MCSENLLVPQGWTALTSLGVTPSALPAPLICKGDSLKSRSLGVSSMSTCPSPLGHPTCWWATQGSLGGSPLLACARPPTLMLLAPHLQKPDPQGHGTGPAFQHFHIAALCLPQSKIQPADAINAALSRWECSSVKGAFWVCIFLSFSPIDFLLLLNPPIHPPVPDYKEYIKYVLYLFRVLCQPR